MSFVIAKKPRDASCLSVVIASVVQYLKRSFLLLVTLASDLPVQSKAVINQDVDHMHAVIHCESKNWTFFI